MHSFKPLVSVVVITFNSAQYIIETLESIKNQVYDHIELVISDDCSHDATTSLCRQWLAENKDRFVHTNLLEASKNTGIPGNCNRGLNASGGEWIKIIAGDDALEKDTLKNYIEFAVAHTGIEVIFSDMQAYSNTFTPERMVQLVSNRSEKFNRNTCTAQEQFEILLRANCINSPTVMLKKSVILRVGGFDTAFRFLEDWPMWLALTKAGIRMHYLNTVSVKYRVHAQSVQGLALKDQYKSKVEMDVDKMFREKYVNELSFLESKARLMMINQDALIIRYLGNRNNKFISVLAKVIGFFPSMILKRCKRKYLSAE